MSSANRRTAFARTPRGAPTSTTSARTGGSARVDKRFLDSLTDARMAPELSTVMTRTAASVQIDIGPNGKGEYNLVTKNGVVIGDAQDIQKVQSLGTFINEERKNVLKNSVSAKTKQILAAMAEREAALGVQPGRRLRFTKAFIDVFRASRNQIDNLDNNIQVISALEVEGADEVVKGYLMDCVRRARNSLVAFLVHRGSIAEGETPRKLNEFLMQEFVPAWVFSKLSGQKIQTNMKGFKTRHLLFPRDVTKGFCISWAEMCHDGFLQQQGQVASGLRNFRGLFSEVAVRGLCAVPDEWDVKDFGPDSGCRKMAQVPILVPAFAEAVDASEIMTVLGKQADRGLNWQAGNGFQPEDILKFLGTVPKRVTTLALGQPLRKVTQLERAFPGFAYNPTAVDQRGPFSQLARWAAEPDRDLSAFVTLVSANRPTLVRDVVLDIMGIKARNDPGYDMVFSAMPEAGQPALGPANQIIPHEGMWEGISQTASGMSVTRVNEILGQDNRLEVSLEAKTKGVKEDAFKAARSPMGTAGTALIAELRRRRYRDLSDRVGQWLRSFFSVVLQDAVAVSLSARLEAYLANPVIFGEADFAAHFEPVGNWADAVQEEETPPEENQEEEDLGDNPDDE